MLNNVTLVGRMATDPELKYTPSGKAVCNFNIAVDRNFKDAEGNRECDFITIVSWQQSAEFVANYLTKGDMVGVVGRIQTRTWQAEDGTKRKAFEIVASDVKGLGKKQSNGAAPESQGDAKATSNGKAQAKPAPVSVASEGEDEGQDFHDPFADI